MLYAVGHFNPKLWFRDIDWEIKNFLEMRLKLGVKNVVHNIWHNIYLYCKVHFQDPDNCNINFYTILLSSLSWLFQLEEKNGASISQLAKLLHELDQCLNDFMKFKETPNPSLNSHFESELYLNCATLLVRRAMKNPKEKMKWMRWAGLLCQSALEGEVATECKIQGETRRAVAADFLETHPITQEDGRESEIMGNRVYNAVFKTSRKKKTSYLAKTSISPSPPSAKEILEITSTEENRPPSVSANCSDLCLLHRSVASTPTSTSAASLMAHSDLPSVSFSPGGNITDSMASDHETRVNYDSYGWGEVKTLVEENNLAYDDAVVKMNKIQKNEKEIAEILRKKDKKLKKVHFKTKINDFYLKKKVLVLTSQTNMTSLAVQFSESLHCSPLTFSARTLKYKDKEDLEGYIQARFIEKTNVSVIIEDIPNMDENEQEHLINLLANQSECKMIIATNIVYEDHQIENTEQTSVKDTEMENILCVKQGPVKSPEELAEIEDIWHLIEDNSGSGAEREQKPPRNDEGIEHLLEELKGAEDQAKTYKKRINDVEKKNIILLKRNLDLTEEIKSARQWVADEKERLKRRPFFKSDLGRETYIEGPGRVKLMKADWVEMKVWMADEAEKRLSRQLLLNAGLQAELAAVKEWAAKIAHIALKRGDLTWEEERELRFAEGRYINSYTVTFDGDEKQIVRKLRSLQRKYKREEKERERRAEVSARVMSLAISWERDGEDMEYKFENHKAQQEAIKIMNEAEGDTVGPSKNQESAEEFPMSDEQLGKGDWFPWATTAWYGQFRPIFK